MTRIWATLVIAGLLAIAGVARAGWKFDGFNAAGTQYAAGYGGGICKTGLVDENGAVTTAPVCHDANGGGANFGFSKYARTLADGRLHLRTQGDGNFIDVLAVDDQGVSYTLVHYDTGKPVRRDTAGQMWMHESKSVLAVEYVARTDIAAFDVSAPLARATKALGPVTTVARAPMWGGVWQRDGYSGVCSTTVTLTFQKKGKLALVLAPSDCMGVPLAGKKKKGTWAAATDGTDTVAITIGAYTSSCALAACTSAMPTDNVCLDCGGLNLHQ